MQALASIESLEKRSLLFKDRTERARTEQAAMTGKRPRALTRTASVSQLSSGSLSQQEFSPQEKLKEKLKQPIINPCLSPRVVIVFDPKPCLEVASAPCSPSFNDKASSPRSVLNSLFSRQRAPAEGVGLGIALHAPEEISNISVVVHSGDHIAIPVRDEVAVPIVQHARRHSHPIPTPGISPCHSQCHPDPFLIRGSKQQQQRPILGWLDHELKVDRRDTFLLAPSPAQGSFVAAALTASTHFLDQCSFCKRHLPKDKDIFMYRGDKAFCSVECRSQQMLMDERSKNCSSSALKRRSVVPSTVAAA